MNREKFLPRASGYHEPSGILQEPIYIAIDFKKPSEVALQHGLKALIYASSGAGKTVLTTTGDHPTLIISAEAGLLSIRDVPGDITVTDGPQLG